MIDISKKETISTTNGAEMVTKPTVDFAEGWSRKQAIEAARKEAMEEAEAAKEAALPWNVEIAKLSGAIADLQKRVKILELQKDG